jgi:nitrate reductase gamma subunit
MFWAQGVFTFKPHVYEFVADASWVFKAHLTLGMTILLVFPFTRLVHMLSAPVWYLNRRGWQLVRTRRGLPRRPEAIAPIYANTMVPPVPAEAKKLKAAE